MEFIPYKSNETLENKCYQIPQELFVNSLYKDKLNSDSKILYAFLIDRLSLSQKNNWKDIDNNVYVQTWEKPLWDRVIREGIKKTLGLRHYVVSLIGRSKNAEHICDHHSW